MKRLFTLALLAVTLPLRAESEYPRLGSDVFDSKANGDTQVDAALARAKTENKHVLIMLGANWDVWSHRLCRTFLANPQINRRIGADYVLVLVDVNTRKGDKRNGALNEKFGDPIQHGLPSLVVLDANGLVLVTQETGNFELDGQHDPQRLGAFLTKWAPVRVAK